MRDTSTAAARLQDRRQGGRLRRRPGAGTDDLSVAKWLTAGAPSLEGVQHLGSAFHQGRNSTEQSATPAFPSLQDIDFDHEAELTTSRRFMLATDERGGGILPPGATCPTSPADNPIGNGGIHAYRAGSLNASTPATAAEAFDAYARDRRAARRSTARRSAPSRRPRCARPT